MGPENRWEPEPVTITLGGVPVALPYAAFLQATREGEAALVDAVRLAIGTAGPVADLFAGLGTFALALPGRVYAAEGARDPIGALKSAAALAGRQIFADHRDLFRRPLTNEESSRFAAIVLDPPRAGAREQVLQLAAATTPVIAYVSCNPGTFARDAEILCQGGYKLDWIQPVGQFRWSTHVELAARFSR
jgi:23S rRNA (uracil1939-C5)-methyltransferase